MKRLVGTLCGIISAALFGLRGVLAQPLLSQQVLDSATDCIVTAVNRWGNVVAIS